MGKNYIPRFSFEISEEQKKRADSALVQYGLRKAIFSRILDDVLDIVEEHGGVAIGVMMSGKTRPRNIIPSMKEAEEAEKRSRKEEK